MDVLVIGNGFDLAHGLKTSYKNFLESCTKKKLEDYTENKHSYRDYCKNNLWMKHFLKRQEELGDNWIDLENEIYDVIKFLKDLPIITGSSVVDELCPQVLSVENNDKEFSFYIRR